MEVPEGVAVRLGEAEVEVWPCEGELKRSGEGAAEAEAPLE